MIRSMSMFKCLWLVQFAVYCAGSLGGSTLKDKFQSLTPSIFANCTHTAAHVEVDLLAPSNILFVEQHAIMSSDGSGRSKPVVGRITEPAHTNGVNGRFTWIKGFVQTSATKIVMTDSWNHCLRSFDRSSGLTSDFAGVCGGRGYKDGANAQFWYPMSIIKDRLDGCQLFVTDHHNKAVRTVNMDGSHVGTFVRSSTLFYLRGIAQDTMGTLYLMANNGIFRVDYDQRQPILLAGNTDHQFKDGDLSTSGFSIVQEAVFISENLLVVADSANDKLRLIDLIEKKVSSIECPPIETPSALWAASGMLYIGGAGSVRMLKCPTGLCITPVSSGSHGNCDNDRFNTRKTMTTRKLTPTTKSTTKSTTESTTKPTTHPTTEPMTTQTTTPKTEPSAGSTVQSTEMTSRYTYSETEKVTEEETSTMVPIRNCESRNITAFVKSDGERPLIQITENYSTNLPLGQHTFRFEKDGGIFCIIHVMVTKDTPKQQLSFQARYKVGCSELSNPIVRGALTAVLNNYIILMKGFCQSDCMLPESPTATYTCDNDELTVLWPTANTYDSLAVNLPANVKKRLIEQSKLPILHIVLFSGAPRVVYPEKTESGSYADLVLAPVCPDDTTYSTAWKV